MSANTFIIRQAVEPDIAQMHTIRMMVKENALQNPDYISLDDYIRLINKDGRGWVCELNGIIVGFAILDLMQKNIWALFVHPDHEKKGFGKKLHDTMLAWYFNKHNIRLSLTTAPGTRAEHFYRSAGWTSCGLTANGEIIFEFYKPSRIISDL